MACNCIITTDQLLAERNTRLSSTIIFGTKDRPGYVCASIGTEVIEKKRGARPVAMLPSYCPFCGTKYEADAAAAA